jgi:D-3-phosphoglycerate dehydrogenase / 2-oxoglutarate reductase
MPRILVAERIAPAGMELLATAGEVIDGGSLDRSGLLEAIGEADALVVRSATQVDAELIARADRLRVIGRAGVGVDNVDVSAATRRGILVCNAPQSNIVSAAEHTLALLLAQARNVPQADRALRAGAWERSRWQGVELMGKTLGLVGLGRVGSMVAQRAAGFGMRLIAFDPYVAKEHAREIGVEVMPSLDALLVQSDFVSIHLPRTPDTEGLIGSREIGLMKPAARLVNTARGGIVDEAALAAAVTDGRLAGAALDVFAEEPTTGGALFDLEDVVLTPHLGASTVEAQDKAGEAVAEMVALALHGEFVPYAVNVSAGAEVSEAVRPFLPLAERLGALLTGLAERPIRALECAYLGRIAEADTRVLTLAVVKGSLAGVVHEPLSFVNAPIIAAERGVEISDRRSAVSRDYVSLISLRGEADDGGVVSVAGTLVGKRNAERVMQVFDFDIEIAPARYMMFFTYEDVPGVIGRVGTILGDRGINIATMEVGRREAGGAALMGLTVDVPVSQDVLDEIASSIGAVRTRFIVLPDGPGASS